MVSLKQLQLIFHRLEQQNDLEQMARDVSWNQLNQHLDHHLREELRKSCASSSDQHQLQ